MTTRRRALYGNVGSYLKSTVPPEKPPRGYLRNEPVRIEPLGILSNRDNNIQIRKSPTLSHCRFSTTEKYTNMKKHFREMVQARNGGEFSGHEAVNILDDYIEMNREQFSSTNIVRRETSVKVLSVWLRENVIRPVHPSHKDSSPMFIDSKRAIYTMNPDSDHKLYICSTPTSHSSSVGRRSSRTSSFKRFFSPSRLRNPGRATLEMLNQPPSAISEPPRHIPRTSNASAIESHSPNHRSLEEETLLHDAALFRILTIVEVPTLDDLTTAPGQPTKSASILSTILSRIGRGGCTPEVDASKDEQMDHLLEDTPSIRALVPWLQLARICAPGLYFKSSGGKPTREDIHGWANTSLQAVRDRYSSITRHGSSPLFPMEFTPIIEAIVQQLFSEKRKRKLALQYLCLVIPQKLRTHLCNVVQFLERTMGTDEVVSLRDPYFLGKKGDTENFEIVFDELRSFIFPQVIAKVDQNKLLEALIELRKEGNLGEEPPELAVDLKRSRENSDNTMVPVRYCEPEFSSVKFDADAEVAHALMAIIDSTNISLAEKQKKCELFREHHPKIYEKYFSHLKW